MSSLLPLSFASPMLLGSLLLLALIWWLLRVTPPRPEIEVFPPLKILAKVLESEVTPRKTPWWVLLMRLAMAAMVILALADPVLNYVVRLANGSGPLVIVVDNGWPSARIFESQMRTANSLIDEAEKGGRILYIAATAAQPSAEAGPFDPTTARKVLATVEPRPVASERGRVLGKIAGLVKGKAGTTVAFLSDGVSLSGDEAAFKSIDTSDLDNFIWFMPKPSSFAAITSVANTADALDIEVANYGPAAMVTIAAFDGKGRRIGETQLVPSGQTGHAILSAPFELRNDVQAVVIEGQKLSAATYVLDETLRRKRVALISGSEYDEGQPLLAPLYYIRKAIEPFADIVDPKSAEIAAGLKEAFESRPSVIIIADVGTIPEAAAAALQQFIENGGILIRFAGPRLAAADEDLFLPVTLRKGERMLGGSMSWTEPQHVAEFPKDGPFAGLTAPDNVTVSRQVLAEPNADTGAQTWASLADGTQLVTAVSRGKGRIVLFHVAPQATWSNLPISGSFVDMLRQTIRLSSGTGGAEGLNGTAFLKPWRTIGAGGALGPAPSDAKPLPIIAGKTPVASIENPPGLYGSDEGAAALNLLQSGTVLQAALPPTMAAKVESRDYVSDENRSLKGILLAIAAIILILDGLAMILMNRRPMFARAAITAALAIVLLPILLTSNGMAQDSDARPGDAEAIAAISVTRLAFIKTGSAETDKVTMEGLQGLTYYLTDKTTLEPADPVGVDAETDELAFYPLLYWPVDPDAPMPSDKALARVDAYMQAGGSVLFDTRDQGGSSFSLIDDASPANTRLRAMLGAMNVPPLEPVPDDHVLTKSFYLLKEFPGRYSGSPLWVEQVLDTVSRADRPVRTGDGVSPILITGNDFASAWALDENGEPLYPTEPDDAEQRIMALRAGVNIVMYMLTGNYKSDQVHIPSLLERLGQ